MTTLNWNEINLLLVVVRFFKCSLCVLSSKRNLLSSLLIESKKKKNSYNENINIPKKKIYKSMEKNKEKV